MRRFRLFAEEGKSFREIAQIERWEYSAVQKSVRLAKEKIKKFFISGKIPAFFLGYRANGEKETFALQLEK